MFYGRCFTQYPSLHVSITIIEDSEAYPLNHTVHCVSYAVVIIDILGGLGVQKYNAQLDVVWCCVEKLSVTINTKELMRFS